MELGFRVGFLFFVLVFPLCINSSDAHQDYSQFLLANGVARTPPMGRNSWNRFQCNIRERIVRILMTVRRKSIETGRGDLRASSTSFPSGIKARADCAHARGLKLGIYSDAV
ncbi:hypothetical protein SLEP1_g11526 [Rubroshorea leprosula]|nr:hypothetical protein SLEP1_g11526 [Rubroshorea leprosula]